MGWWSLLTAIVADGSGHWMVTHTQGSLITLVAGLARAVLEGQGADGRGMVQEGGEG